MSSPEPDTTTADHAAGPRQPFVGEVVHYVSYGTPGGEYGKQCRAALVTAIRTDLDCDPGTKQWGLSLSVHNPTGLFFNQAVPHDGVTPPKEAESGPSGRAGGTWHYLDQCGPAR